MKGGVIAVLVIIVILFGGVFTAKKILTTHNPQPTPTLAPLQELTEDQYPTVSLKFSSDGHYVTVDIINIHSDQLEYNLIYDAVVKGNKIQTGVNASAKQEGSTTYSKQQLLGSESSGKFTYHTNIKNAVMELTLRDAGNRSVYSATYPFEVIPGSTADLKPSE
ncbi:MAG: hypothetical protein AAB909_01645 [Patescibacteria group bacterium]